MKKRNKNNTTVTADAPRNYIRVQMIHMSSAAKGAHKDKKKYTRKMKHKSAW